MIFSRFGVYKFHGEWRKAIIYRKSAVKYNNKGRAVICKKGMVKRVKMVIKRFYMNYLEKPSFNLELRSSHSLNYLIYIQNIYLNLQSSLNENHKFPYIINQENGLEINEFPHVF